MLFSANPNPVAFAHLRARGGFRMLGMMAAVYIAAVLVLTVFVWRTNSDPATAIDRTLQGSLILLAVAQIGVLGFIGTLSVSSAIGMDESSGMFEVHRLTPMSPLTAVTGYHIGGAAQAMTIGLCTFAIGLAYAGMVGMGAHWVAFNFFAVLAAVCGWALIILLRLAFRRMFILVLMALGVAVVAGMTSLGISRAMYTLASGILTSFTPMVRSGGQLDVSAAAIVGAIFLAVLTLLLTLGAMRRFTEPARPGLGLLLSMVLVAWWCGLAIIAQALPRDAWFSYRYDTAPRYEEMLVVQLVGTALTFLVLVNTAHEARRRPGATAMQVIARSAAAGVAAAAVLSLTIWAHAAPLQERATLASGMHAYLFAAMAISCIAAAAAAEWMGRRTSPWWAVVLVLLIGYVLPLIAAGVIGEAGHLDGLANLVNGISPLGLLNQAWTSEYHPSAAASGRAAVVAHALLAATLLLAAKLKTSRPAPASANPPPLPPRNA